VKDDRDWEGERGGSIASAFLYSSRTAEDTGKSRRPWRAGESSELADMKGTSMCIQRSDGSHTLQELVKAARERDTSISPLDHQGLGVARAERRKDP
jgi:hypothetical protein